LALLTAALIGFDFFFAGGAGAGSGAFLFLSSTMVSSSER
jgi:hypothetical protein